MRHCADEEGTENNMNNTFISRAEGIIDLLSQRNAHPETALNQEALEQKAQEIEQLKQLLATERE